MFLWAFYMSWGIFYCICSTSWIVAKSRHLYKIWVMFFPTSVPINTLNSFLKWTFSPNFKFFLAWQPVCAENAAKPQPILRNAHLSPFYWPFFQVNLGCAQPTLPKHWRENITFHWLDHPKLAWGLPTLSLTSNSFWLPCGRVAMPLIRHLMPVPQTLRNAHVTCK